MQQQTLDLIKALADKLGLALSDLVKAYTKQCVAEGWYSFIEALALFIGFFFVCRFIKRYMDSLEARPDYRHDHLTLQLIRGGLYVLGIFTLLIPAVVAFGNITKALAPEACAITLILETVKK